MANFTISFLIEKNIYVEDVKDDEEAINKASVHLFNLLSSNHAIVNHSKITVKKSGE